MPIPSDPAPVRDWNNPDTYRDGPAQLLAQLRAFNASPPVDAQHRVLAELDAYARIDEGMYAPTTALPPGIVTSFHDSLRKIAALLDAEVIRTHPRLVPSLRLGLLGLRTGEALHLPQQRRSDAGRGLDRVTYLVAGTPSEATDSVHAKTRAIELIGDTIASERILWVPAGAPVSIVGSRQVDIPPAPPSVRGALDKARGRSPVALVRTVLHDRALLRQSRRPEIAERYAGAWLLMDRDTFAQDNAEHLYRHLLAEEPDVNAWFVLRRDSSDWNRLQADGFKLIAYGSDEYFLALLHCAHLISSQVDGYVVRPFLGHVLGAQRWRYTFLQHGVITQDLSRWLNIKPIDLLVTTTPTEQASITADGTHYELTDLESRQVGLARHDRLVKLGGYIKRRRLLVTPTWRSELLGEQTDGNKRGLQADFWSSRYATEWAGLLSSPELKAVCERAGWELTFMPHPNMQDYLATSPLPDHVTTLRFDSVDVQQIFAEAAAWVTDFSSLGTEAAVLQCPVVYFQFDRDEFYSGRLYQQSSWSYPDDGYGPVTDTQRQAIDAIDQLATNGIDAKYLARMQTALPLRDGRNCARTVEAIRAINRR